MNELFFLLIESMKEEADCYRRLALLAHDQKELLISGSVRVLPANTRLQEKQVFALTPIMGRKEEKLTELANFFGLKKMSLNDAIKKAPIEVAKELTQAQKELVDVAKKLRGINSVSKKLLDNATQLTKVTLKAIREGGKKKSFSMSAAMEGSKPSFVNRVV